MKRIFYLTFSGFIIFILLLLLFNGEKMKERYILSAASFIFSAKQDVWFHYAEIDSLYEVSCFRFFIFYKEGDILTNMDSTLYVLNENESLPDSIITQLQYKIHLPTSAFPYILNAKKNIIICRVDSIKKENGRIRYKLHKMKVQ